MPLRPKRTFTSHTMAKIMIKNNHNALARKWAIFDSIYSVENTFSAASNVA